MNLQEMKRIDSSIELLSEEKDFFDINSISHITEPRDGSFVFCKNSKYLSRAGDKSEHSSFLKTGIILESKFAQKMSDQDFIELKQKFGWVAKVDNVGISMTAFSKPFYDTKFSDLNYFVDGRQMGTCEIDPSAQIAQSVFIGENVSIGANVTLMPGVRILPNVKIEEGSTLYPNVVIYPYVKIGKNCRIHGNVTIGGDGFGYTFFSGEHCKIWHFGGVEIGNNVELGANSTVDAGAFYPTRIGDGTKVDNHSTIGHNVQLGKGVVVCGQGAIAGSVEMDDFSVMGGRAAIGPDTRIGKGAQVAASAIVSESVVIEPGAVVAGHPARPLKEWLRGLAYLRKNSLK